MTIPTAAQIIDWSQVDFPARGFEDEAQVQVLVDRAAAYIRWATGQPLDTLPDSDLLKPMIEQAIQAKAEVLAYQAQPDLIETAADFMLISSFSAGNYTETRRSLSELKDGGMLDADPRINALLWPILTDDMRDLWMAWFTGKNPPAFEVTVVDWTPVYEAGYFSWDSWFGMNLISEWEPWSMSF